MTRVSRDIAFLESVAERVDVDQVQVQGEAAAEQGGAGK